MSHRETRKLARRVKAKRAASRAAAMPAGKYRVIYADPPWAYGNEQPNYHATQENHYALMSLDDICHCPLDGQPIDSILEDNAVLFLWTTSPMLAESFDVVRAWGFEYKSSFVWDKVKHNMGHYNSVRHEILLICTRGACTPDIPRLFDSVVTEERTEHSRKPETFYEIIDTIYPHGARIELWARSGRDGWSSYGDQSNA